MADLSGINAGISALLGKFGGVQAARPQEGIAATLVRNAQLAQGPAFELQFFATQNAAIGRLNAEIEKINTEADANGKNALFDIELEGLDRRHGAAALFRDQTVAKLGKVKQIELQLLELSTLSGPGTLAAFDTLKAEIRSVVQKLDTPLVQSLGMPDGSYKLKREALARLDAIIHNDFSTQTDIDAVKAELAALGERFASVKTAVAINDDLADALVISLDRQRNEVRGAITAAKIDATADVTERVKQKKDQLSQILTVFSLAFEASKGLTDYIAANTVMRPVGKAGSVFDLIA